jgi:heme exporter protein A
VTDLLRFDAVSCVRGGRLLFERLDFAVGAGEALQVAGPNGSGKSSLLRLAAGLLRPAAGRVNAAAVALADDSLALDRELPLGKALDFWGGDSKAAMRALGLGELADVPVRFLSAGQERRASLARAAASGAPLWLLDEPANALDERSLRLLVGLVERHRSSGGAVVAASHLPLAGDWRIMEIGQ